MSRIVGRDDTHLKLQNLSEKALYAYNTHAYTIVEHDGNYLYTYDILERHNVLCSGLSAEEVSKYFESILNTETWFCEADFFDHPNLWNIIDVMEALDDYKREHLDMDKDTILEMFWDGDIPEAPDPEY